MLAFVLIDCMTPADAPVVYAELLHIPDPHILEVQPLMGEHDLIVKVEGATELAIGRYVLSVISSLPGVAGTKTLGVVG